MLVFPCFPAIARRGFAKFVWADLAKPTRFCTPGFLQTLTLVGQNEKGGDVEAWTFATRKRVCAGVANVQKVARCFPRRELLPRVVSRPLFFVS